MTVRFRVAAVSAACVCVAALLGGCGGAAASVNQATLIVTPMSAVVTTAPLPTTEDGVQVVARVNGQAILLPTFQRALERAEIQQIVVQNVPGFQDSVLNILVEQSLITQAAESLAVTVSDEEVNAELQGSIELAGGADAWQQWLDINAYTEEEFRATLYDALLTSRMRDFVTASLATGDVPYARARHILVSSVDTALSLMQQIEAGGDFAALASQYSADETTKNNGGDLGWFAEDELLQPALAYAAFAGEIGQLQGPIRTELGYHVLQVTERENRAVADDRRAVLAQARFTNWLSSLSAAATIERFIQ
ncbi:MAG: peptidylprolyl isomerase [Pleurocapsa minor GSE-CHR-MK-17-07R]|nr:peptidylprolyl isomerase [Pleurocapsa minor GSE-CHR-MK 17-07R]